MSAAVQTNDAQERMSRTEPTHGGIGRDESIAIVTSLSSVVSILTQGVETDALNQRTISKLNMRPFMAKHGLQDLNLSLYYVPSIEGEWTQKDPGYLAQMRNALRSSTAYDRVINIGHAIPLYRRHRTHVQGSKSNLINAAVEFAQTLTALAVSSHALGQEVLEPRNLHRGFYSFDTTKFGEISVSDMDVTEGLWQTSQNDKFWASKTGVGHESLDAFEIPDAHHRVADGNRYLGEWLDNLGMGPLSNRFIYSPFHFDFERQVERLWEFDSELPEGQKLLVGADELKQQSDSKLLHNEHGIDLTNADLRNPEMVSAFKMMKYAIGRKDQMKMIDISTLLHLNRAGGAPEDAAVIDQNYKDAARVLLKEFPFSVAFQKMWDRQAWLYDEEKLNKKINAWYISNTHLYAKSVLKEKLPEFNVWGIPMMPTNSVRFVLKPSLQRKNTENALINAFLKLKLLARDHSTA